MDEPTVLRTTKIGGGFVKEDVMQYLDELNSKINMLQDENEKLQKAGPSNSADDEIRKYKNQVENLQEKLNNANNLLRTKNKELEAAKATISQLQAGKPLPAGVVPAVDTAQLDAAKKEIETLKKQLQAVQKSPTAQPSNNNDSAELAKAKQDLARMSGELAARAKAADEKARESAAKDAKIAQLIKDNAAALAKKDEEIAKKNAELAAKDVEIKTANEKANNPALMMSDLFIQAQKTTEQLKKQAQEEADTITKEASEKAEKLIGDAKAEAEKTISAANTTAESCIKDANIKAKTTIDEANKHADTVNEMSATVRKMLVNEIENISSKFSDITARLDEAKSVVGEARKSIDTNASQDIKKMEAPKVDMSDVKSAAEKIATPPPAPKVTEKPAAKPNNSARPANNIKPVSAPAPAPAPVQPKPQPKKSIVGMDGMDDIMKSFSVNPTAPAPAPAPAKPKPQPKKPVMNLGDDMADLLKAIEADPNNIGE